MSESQLKPIPLSPKQAAAQIGISPAAVYELCDAGLIAYRRVGAKGGRIRFDQADVDAYLAATRVEPSPSVKMPQSRAGRRKAATGVNHGFSILRAAGWDGKSRMSS
jgi:excisionase family DNA binding protein